MGGIKLFLARLKQDPGKCTPEIINFEKLIFTVGNVVLFGVSFLHFENMFYKFKYDKRNYLLDYSYKYKKNSQISICDIQNCKVLLQQIEAH